LLYHTKKLSIEELIQNMMRFPPTIVIPYSKDRSNNHAFVVIHDIIFNSTQVYAMKLFRENLDCWISGDMGIASALHFILKHKDTMNW
jgi:hypothetical protein